MTTWWVAAGSALWLGLLTSVSPCPLATNIAAVSYLGRQTDSRAAAVGSASAYVLGRSLAYAALGALLVAGALAIPTTSLFLGRFMNRLLGPLLILIGVVLLDLLPLRLSTTAGSDAVRKRLAGAGALGAFVLGALFALSFCPISAALFFGSLIPLAVQHTSPVSLPLLYGLGTGLPVLGLGILIAIGADSLGRVLKRLDQVQRWLRLGTGVVVIGVGIYYTIRFIFLA